MLNRLCTNVGYRDIPLEKLSVGKRPDFGQLLQAKAAQF